MRSLCLLLALAASAAGGDPAELEQPATSVKARQLREQGQALWVGVAPVWEKLRGKKEVGPDEAAAALPSVERAIELLERSLREEWNGETNRTQADAVRAWFALRPLVPPAPAPEGEEAQRRAVRAAEEARRDRSADARRFVMDYGRERRVESLFRRCATCDGRKEIRSPFGERRDCAACAKAGKVLDREALLEARWLRFTPLYRAEGRNSREINRLLRAAATKPEALAPYVKSVEIRDVEDHDFWMRVTAREQVQADAASQKTEKTEVVYILLRVGKVWYLHDVRTDRELLDAGGP